MFPLGQMWGNSGGRMGQFPCKVTFYNVKLRFTKAIKKTLENQHFIDNPRP